MFTCVLYQVFSKVSNSLSHIDSPECIEHHVTAMNYIPTLYFVQTTFLRILKKKA